MKVTIVPQSAELIWITPNVAKNIELIGKKCYKAESNITEDSAPKFIKKIVSAQHFNVIEHGVASISLITNRAIANELTRHRMASYCQESTRYVNYNKRFGLQVIKPLGLTQAQETIWNQSVEEAAQSYEEMIITGASPEVARDVLPHCTKTELVATMNFSSWMNVINLRLRGTKGKPHPQIAELIGYVSAILAKECPEVFKET